MKFLQVWNAYDCDFCDPEWKGRPDTAMFINATAICLIYQRAPGVVGVEAKGAEFFTPGTAADIARFLETPDGPDQS